MRMQTKSQESWGVFWPAFSFFLCPPHFFSLSLLPPLTWDKTLTRTTTGVHFHTLPGGCYCYERVCESGKEVGACEHGVVGEVWREPSQIWQWKNNQESKRRWSNEINSSTVFLFSGSCLKVAVTFFVLYFSVSSSSCFLFLFTASSKEGGVICLH